MSKTMIFIPDTLLPSCIQIVVGDEMVSGDAVAPTLPGTYAVAVADDPVDTLTIAPPETPETLFSFDLRNGANAAPTDYPALRIRLNGGSWQSPSALGLTVVGFNTTTREIEFDGPAGWLTGVTTVDVHFEQEQPGEPYSAAGATSGAIYVRGPAAPANTALPGISLAPTFADSPIAATIG
ncbi:MAG: hypothetical protein J0M19_15230 [Sphingomonadales bacterium]|nr:hypothetical protein [Sphingomonadales bacterium]